MRGEKALETRRRQISGLKRIERRAAVQYNNES